MKHADTPDTEEQAYQMQLHALAEEFLDVWQGNIRLWSGEKDLFTLRSLLELMVGDNDPNGISSKMNKPNE